ncbi:MAG TPA: Hsp20/alpha crystallin family protein [Bacteroidia bacterium]|jgi:HSP20 family protein|nr:Hsp20/alpha crystallin family protein [Bacteroidia bacterium]
MKTLVRSNRSLLPEFPSLLDDLFTRDIYNWSVDKQLTGNSTVPSVNIMENEKNFEVEVAAPGLDKNNFKVELDNDMLMISAHRETRNEEKNKEGNYTRREFSYESFQRSFQLPEDLVEKDKISASYRDGILHITIPKSVRAKVKSSRIIEIG